MRKIVLVVTWLVVERVIERGGFGDEAVFGGLGVRSFCMRREPERTLDRLRGEDALGVLQQRRYMRLIDFRGTGLTV